MKSGLRLFDKCAEFLGRDLVPSIPRGTRGIYALLKQSRRRGKTKYDVVYIGMSTTSVHGRLRSHASSAKKAELWSHFSVYSVWPNITDAEIVELEGLLRAIYRKDSRANSIAVQKGFKKLRVVRNNKLDRWNEPVIPTRTR